MSRSTGPDESRSPGDRDPAADRAPTEGDPSSWAPTNAPDGGLGGDTEGWTWSKEVAFPSSLGAHLPFLEEVLAAVADLGWSGRDFFGVQMTLEETLSNAIRHGNRGEVSKLVRAEARASAERFFLSVEDEGEGFTLAKVPDCRTGDGLMAHGGRGMLLIHAYMADVRLNERGNRITVQTHRGFRPPDPPEEIDGPPFLDGFSEEELLGLLGGGDVEGAGGDESSPDDGAERGATKQGGPDE